MKVVRTRLLILAAALATCLVSQQPKPGAGSIEGRVRTMAGMPIKKASVTLTAQGTQNYQIQLTADTDAEGKFEFSSLPAGTYRLSASRPGFQDHAAARNFPISASDRIAGAEIRLPQQSVISGRVFDGDGDSSPNITVLIFKQSYRGGLKHWEVANTVGTTNENGEYRIPYLAPGRYILRTQKGRSMPENRYDDSDFPLPVIHLLRPHVLPLVT